MANDQVKPNDQVPAGKLPTDLDRLIIPVGIDSAAFAVCMVIVRNPVVCSRVAAAASARAAQRDANPAGVAL